MHTRAYARLAKWLLRHIGLAWLGLACGAAPQPADEYAHAHDILKDMRIRGDRARQLEYAGRYRVEGQSKTLDCAGAWRIAFIHIPKCGGTSVIDAFSRNRAIHHWACEKHGLLPPHGKPCPCDLPRCAASARLWAGEMPFAHFRRLADSAPAAVRECTLYLATVRQPRSWFYSARDWMCSHHQNAACRQNATASDMRSLGAFRPTDPLTEWSGFEHHGTRPGGGPAPFIKYFFKHANLQSQMLGDVFFEQNHVVCPLNELSSTIGRLLPAVLLRPGEPPPAANWTIHRENRGRKRRAGQHAVEAPPWAQVARFYALDEALYQRVSAHAGGCVGSITDAELARRLQSAGAMPRPWHASPSTGPANEAAPNHAAQSAAPTGQGGAV